MQCRGHSNGIVHAPAPSIPEIRLPHPEMGRPSKSMALALLTALAVHLAVLVVILRQRETDPLPDEFSEAVSIEMVPLSALTPPPPITPVPVPAEPAPVETLPGGTAPETAAPPPSPQSKPAAPPVPPGMIRATTMLAARNLAGSRQARTAMRMLTSDTRVEQLCGLEAMEQVHAWQRDYQPDRIVVYAMGEPTMTGSLFEADGAAFRSRSLWYRIRFTCELTPDRARVTAFAFAVGAAVPREDWEDHGLPAVH